MKILLFGDAHITARTEFSKPTEDGLTDHLHDILDSFTWLRGLADREQVSLIINLGDLLDSTAAISEQVLYTAAECYRKISCGEIPYIQLLGNHDYRAEVLRDRALGFLSRGHLITQPRYMLCVHGQERVGLLALPCMESYPVSLDRMLAGEGLPDPASAARAAKDPVRLVVGHVPVIGARYSVHSPKTEDRGFDLTALDQVRYFVNGHYHCPGAHPQNPRVVYAGSLVAQSFDDVLAEGGPERGALILDTGSWTLTRHANPHTPRFVDRTPETLLAEPHPERLFVRLFHAEAETDMAEALVPITRGCRRMPQLSPVPTVEARADEVDEARIVEEYVRTRAPADFLPEITRYGQKLLSARREQADGRPVGRRVIVQQVAAENFAILGVVDWRPQVGMTLVLGQNDDAGATGDSNGAGKSSLFEALLWCLYGDSPKGKADEVIRDGEKWCRVTVRLLVDGSQYTVCRYRGLPEWGNGARLFTGEGRELAADALISGKAVAEASRQIVELLGLDYATFCQIVLLRDDLTARFMALSPADRIRLLEDVFGLTWYDGQADRTRKELMQAEAEVGRLEGRVQAAEQQLEACTGQLAEARQVPDLQPQILLVGQRQDALAAELQEIDAARERVEAEAEQCQGGLAAELREIDAARESAESEARQAGIGLDRLNEEIGQLGKLVGEAREQQGAVTATLTGYAGREAEVQSLLAQGRCPLCRSVCTAVHFDAELRVLAEAAARARAEEQSILGRLEGFRGREQGLQGVLQQTREQRQQHQTRVQGCQAQRQAVECRIREEQRQRQARMQGYQARRGEVEGKARECARLAAQLKEQQASAAGVIAALEQAQARARQEIAAERVASAQARQEATVLAWWSKALATDGVRGKILEARVEWVNRWLEGNTQRIWTAGQIRLVHTRGAKLGISVGQRKYERHSRGERKRIDILLQLLLNQLYRMARGVDVRLLLCDEVLDGLDTSGLQVILALIREMLCGSAVCLTSHNEILKGMLPEKIVIHRAGGVGALVESGVA